MARFSLADIRPGHTIQARPFGAEVREYTVVQNLTPHSWRCRNAHGGLEIITSVTIKRAKEALKRPA